MTAQHVTLACRQVLLLLRIGPKHQVRSVVVVRIEKGVMERPIALGRMVQTQIVSNLVRYDIAQVIVTVSLLKQRDGNTASVAWSEEGRTRDSRCNA